MVSGTPLDTMNAEELAHLGRNYREGNGVDEDMAKAVDCFTRAADMGDVQSAASLGYIYLSGEEGIRADREKAAKYLRQAADGGDATAMCNYGVLISKEDPAGAVDWYQKAAENGSVLAMKNLAVAYGTALGVPADKQKSVEWYTKAAELDDIDSIVVLAAMYRNGDGVDVDKAKAADLYRRAAKSGDMEAQYDLAFMLDAGEGIPEDKKTAEIWFRASADQGDTDACLCIGGILFERGEYIEAEQYFRSAAEKDDVKAQYNLGLMYMGEYLGQPDMDKAKKWFKSAADIGFAFAQTMMGSMSLDAGKTKDAERWFRMAADQGEPTAEYNLGALALSGQIKMGTEEATRLLMASATKGYEPAYQLLVQLNGH